MLEQDQPSGRLHGQTGVIELYGAIRRAQHAVENQLVLYADALEMAHSLFRCPTEEEMKGIKTQYTYWQIESPARTGRIRNFLLSIGLEVPELGIVK